MRDVETEAQLLYTDYLAAKDERLPAWPSLPDAEKAAWRAVALGALRRAGDVSVGGPSDPDPPA